MSRSIPTSLALAAAALFLGGCEKDSASATPDDAAAGGDTTAAKVKKIKCFGANECAGQAACDVPDGRVEPGSVGHVCAGQNECKGKGWISLTASDCTAQGGEPL